MKLTIELPEDIERQIRDELRKEVKEEISEECLREYIKTVDNYELIELIRDHSGMYERYESIKGKPISKLTKSQKIILLLYNTLIANYK